MRTGSGVPFEGAMTTTYYHDEAVHISSGGVQVAGAWYPLSALTYVWHRRTGRLRHGAYMIASRTAALGMVVALLIGGGYAARSIKVSGDQKTMLIAGGILAVVVIGGVAAFGIEGLLELVDRTHEHGKGLHEIWIRCGDEETMLYSTTDSTRFGQIYRALQRAIENGS
jgi:hypothetical protein